MGVSATAALCEAAVKTEEEDYDMPKRHVLAAVIPQGPKRQNSINIGTNLSLTNAQKLSLANNTIVTTQAVTSTGLGNPFAVTQQQLSDSLGPSTTVSLASLTPTSLVPPTGQATSPPFTTLTVVRQPQPPPNSFKAPVSLVPLAMTSTAASTMTAAGGATIHPIIASASNSCQAAAIKTNSVTIMPASTAAAAAAPICSKIAASAATLISLKSETATSRPVQQLLGNEGEHKGKAKFSLQH